MSVLNEICEKKRGHVKAQKAKISLADIKAQAAAQAAPKGFINALQSKEGPALIAEVKKASPSKGIIREDFNPADIAKAYKAGGASCLSVLTDTPYFQGTDEIFATVRESVDLPLLRKDFMVDPYQIPESRALGADCILLIMAALSDEQAQELYGIAREYKMDALVEVHDQEELERAKTLNPQMIGVNNRNLKTLNVDIQTSFDLFSQMPGNTLPVAESGIDGPDTLYALHNKGYKAFLVGESLMRQADIKAATQHLLTQNKN